MLSSLMFTAFLMGLGGMPHCAAMCGAGCAAFLPRGVPPASLLGRCLGYALLGALAASSVGLAARLGGQVAFLQPLWVLAQAMAMLLGLYLVVAGHMPQQLDAVGQDLYRRIQSRVSRSAWPRGRLPWQVVIGMAWALLPCGLLYAALTVAALAPNPSGGALVMLAFAIPSGVGVWAAPAVLSRLGGWARGRRRALSRAADPAPGAISQVAATTPPTFAPVIWLRADAGVFPPSREGAAIEPIALTQGAPGLDPRWAVRLSGAMLAAMAAWALYHQIVSQWQAWCA